MARTRRNRWGKLSEIDRRHRVGSPGYEQYPDRLKHLLAWRAMHKVAGGHMPVRMAGTRAKIRPSSDMPIPRKEAFVRKRS